MSAPLNYGTRSLLTSEEETDILHRRAGRDVRPKEGYRRHADAHKYCPLGRCGNRPGAYEGRYHISRTKTEKIIAWRKAKAYEARGKREEINDHTDSAIASMVHFDQSRQIARARRPG